MANHVNSLLILDSKNKYNDANFRDKKIKITSIERVRNHETGLKTLKKVRPDVMIIVIDEENGCSFNDTVNFLSHAREIAGGMQMLVVNVENNKDKIYKLISLGVNGVHDGKTNSLLMALNQLQTYQSFFSSSYQYALLEKFQQEPPQQVNLRVNYQEAKKLLTNREIELLEDLITNDGTYEERGRRLFISPKTLKNHMVRMIDKLEAENRTHIIGISIKKGIIEMVSE